MTNHITKKKLIRIAIAVAICLLVGVLAAYATQTSITTWYATLKKPSFNPPNWVFSRVLTALYVFLGIAAGIVWIRGFYHRWVKTALYHFGFQLLLSGMWSVVFFGLEKPLAGLLVMITLFILLLITFKWFKLVSPVASYLLIPYVLWVIFAMVFNFEIWRLN